MKKKEQEQSKKRESGKRENKKKKNEQRQSKKRERERERERERKTFVCLAVTIRAMTAFVWIRKPRPTFQPIRRHQNQIQGAGILVIGEIFDGKMVAKNILLVFFEKRERHQP
jgi:hypothetical protein